MGVVTSIEAIKIAYDAMESAIWDATHGNPPFGANPGPSDATPEEVAEESRSYAEARQAWIDEQWQEVAAAERKLSSLLESAGIPRPVWDYYTEGIIDEPTCTAYQRARRADSIAMKYWSLPCSLSMCAISTSTATVAEEKQWAPRHSSKACMAGATKHYIG